MEMDDGMYTNQQAQACGSAPDKFKAFNRRNTRGEIPEPNAEGIINLEPQFVNEESH